MSNFTPKSETLVKSFIKFLVQEGVLGRDSGLKTEPMFTVGDPVELGVLGFYEDVMVQLLVKMTLVDLRKLASYHVQSYMRTQRFSEDLADIQSFTSQKTTAHHKRS